MGCVSPELVRATQYSRFGGQYALAEGAAMSGAWWPALLFCLLFYGVLPRLLFSLGLWMIVRRRAARLSERVLELRGRLRAGVEVIASRTHPEPDGAEPAPHVIEQPARHGATPLTCWLLRWRGAALDERDLAALSERLGLTILRHDAAGSSDFAHDDALLENAPAGAGAVLLLAEGWEAPDKATRRFVQALRRTGPPDRPVFVCVLLADADAGTLALWRDRLRLLQDPWISVQALVASTGSPRLRSEGAG
jgi:hypothetical protein